MSQSHYFPGCHCDYHNNLSSSVAISVDSPRLNARHLKSYLILGGEAGVVIPDEFVGKKTEIKWRFYITKGSVKACVRQSLPEGEQNLIYLSQKSWEAGGTFKKTHFAKHSLTVPEGDCIAALCIRADSEAVLARIEFSMD